MVRSPLVYHNAFSHIDWQSKKCKIYFRFYAPGPEDLRSDSSRAVNFEEDPEIEAVVSDFERVRMLPKSTGIQRKAKNHVLMWFCVSNSLFGFPPSTNGSNLVYT